MSEPPNKDDSSVDPGIDTGNPDMWIGKVISGRYRIDSVIASGGVGYVFQGTHVHMRKHVAIKILNSAMDRLPHVKARFEHEAMAGAHIEHPNVAAATDFGRLEDGCYFLIMEYVHGRTLRDAMANRHFTAQRVIRIGRQIAEGLHAAHSVGIIHRDVKPANIMIARDSDDLVKIIDFGFAKLDFERLPKATGKIGTTTKLVTAAGLAFGTPPYMAPEAAAGMDNVDARSDLYALGVILFEMLAGVKPFDDPDPVRLLRRKMHEAPPSLLSLAPAGSVPVELDAVIMRLLARDKSDRYGNGKVVAAELEAIESSCFQSTPYPRSLPPPPMRPSDPQPAQRAAPAPAAAQIPPPRVLAAPSPRTKLWLVLPAAVGMVTIALLAGAIGMRCTARPKKASAVLSASMQLAPEVASAPVEASASSVEPPPPAPTGEVESARAEFWRCVAGRDWKAGARAMLAIAELDRHCFDQAGFIHAASSIAGAVDMTDAALSKQIFDMLAARADTGGADVLYDIMITKGASRGAGKKAWTLLQRDDVRGRASAATQIAVELNLSDCAKKRTLYDTALADGDERALTELQSLLSYPCDRKKRKPCCFRSDNRLQSTIQALHARLKAAPSPSGDRR